MTDRKKISLQSIKDAAVKSASALDLETAKEKAARAGEIIGSKAVEIKDSAIAMKDDIAEKLTELDRMLASSITEYNDAYTLMNDKGVQLFIERTRAVDTISFVESLVNSIANRPKSFDAEFEEIRLERDSFLNTCDFGQRELQAAREAAGGAGAGIAAGASVAFMAPTAAMWVATTFGTASTGTAISALSGAAATNAALAWLGGGALSPVTCQMLSDITGRVIETIDEPQNAGTVGAALLIALGMKIIDTPEEAGKLISVKKVYRPDIENKEVYERNYQVFRRLYKSNAKHFKVLNEI